MSHEAVAVAARALIDAIHPDIWDLPYLAEVVVPAAPLLELREAIRVADLADDEPDDGPARAGS